jgi:hypothetical protein
MRNTELTLPHDHTAHEDLNRPDALERHLALSCCLVETKLSPVPCQRFLPEFRVSLFLPELVLGYRLRVVNLVTQHQEGDVGQRLHSQQRIELGLRLSETLVVLGVNEEYDTADLGEVVTP